MNRPPSTQRPFNPRPLIILALAASLLPGQEIEPRAYTNAPLGVNFLILGYGYTDGGLATDPALPLVDPKLKTDNLLAAFARSLELWGKSAKVDVIFPYTWLSGTAQLRNEPIEREVNGFMDPKVRLAVNLIGAPALSLDGFRRYTQDLLVGVSLQVSVPSGQYDRTRLVNIGMNRWSFKPELGISKRLGVFTLEGAGAVTFYTTNPDFYGGKRRAQSPLYSLQTHGIYNFPSRIWLAVGFTYFGGGSTTVSGQEKDDLQSNWRLGGTLAVPVNARNSLKFSASNGVVARTGNNLFMAGVAWQYRWGGGL